VASPTSVRPGDAARATFPPTIPPAGVRPESRAESHVADRASSRRSQRDRSAATINALLDATISAIVAVGCARTTTREICTRAGVSQGGLFRHFATRKEVLIAALERLQLEQLDAIERALRPGARRPTIGAALECLGPPAATVWLELSVAARTDQQLLTRFQPLFDDHLARIRALLRQQPWFAALAPAAQSVWLTMAWETSTTESLQLPADAQAWPRSEIAAALDALVDLLGGQG
jgi:AcrR family transcriptional regulator